MRALMIGVGIVAILLAGFLAARDNSAHSSSVSQAAPAGAPALAPAAPQAPVFLVRGVNGVNAFDSSTGRVRYNLPRGLASADRAHFYSAHVDANSTVIISNDLATGAPLPNPFVIDGQWTLAAVSASGRWLALDGLLDDRAISTISRTRQWRTRLAIVDANDGKLVHSLLLDGDFDVDAISNDGTSLYLIEHLPEASANRYAVRLYDLDKNKLLPGSVRVKGETEDMVGEAYSSIPSLDGHWLFTLYLNTESHTAFIHALDLWQHYALCFDLPSGGGNLDELRQYSLAVSPDSRMVYALNPALGIAANMDVNALGDMHVATFSPQATGNESTAGSDASPGTSLVSPDGARVYFAGRGLVWAFDTNSKQVIGPIAVNAPVLGLGLSVNGKRLYAITDWTGSAIPFDVQANGSLARSN